MKYPWDYEFTPWEGGGKTSRWEESVAWVELGQLKRPRVLVTADWLDPEVPVEWLADLLALIAATPHLDWLLCSKRPELWEERIMAVMAIYPGSVVNKQGKDLSHPWIMFDERRSPANVWVGTTVEGQPSADKRIPELLKIPARVRVLRCEPLLGPVDLACPGCEGSGYQTSGPNEFPCESCSDDGFCEETGLPSGADLGSGTCLGNGVDWVIAGGESGPGARPSHPSWFGSLRDQCDRTGVPFWFSGWGDWRPRYDPCAENGYADTPEGPVIRMGEHGRDTRLLENCTEDMGEEYFMERVGKKAAGRLLDGEEHNEVPS